jgi:hypothetical protein
MLRRPENDWDPIGWRSDARSIVSCAYQSGNTEAVEFANEVTDFYVRNGELDFRDLVKLA